MGNCFPFSFFINSDDDLIRLNSNRNELERRNQNSTLSLRNCQFLENENVNGCNRSGYYHRNSHPSSYVNELFLNASMNNDLNGNNTIDRRKLEEKRNARIKGLLEQIPVDFYTQKGKSNDECAICMINFVPNESIRYLPCMHSYHLECIDDWLLRSFTCPSCMEPVDSAILSAYTVNNVNTNLSFLKSN